MKKYTSLQPCTPSLLGRLRDLLARPTPLSREGLHALPLDST